MSVMSQVSVLLPSYLYEEIKNEVSVDSSHCPYMQVQVWTTDHSQVNSRSTPTRPMWLKHIGSCDAAVLVLSFTLVTTDRICNIISFHTVSGISNSNSSVIVIEVGLCWGTPNQHRPGNSYVTLCSPPNCRLKPIFPQCFPVHHGAFELKLFTPVL
jgi:hypothetical protein